MKLLKDREFYKTLVACDIIMDCMDEKTGIVTDLTLLKKELKDVLE